MSENSKFQVEFRKPGLNPFMTLLSAQPKSGALTPLQELHAELRALEKLAETGDAKGWQEKLPQVQAKIEAVHSDELRRLELQVQVKQYELTLFLQASKKALQQAQAEEKRAQEAQLGDDAQASREHFNRAMKLKRLGEHFQTQLQVQVAA